MEIVRMLIGNHLRNHQFQKHENIRNFNFQNAIILDQRTFYDFDCCEGGVGERLCECVHHSDLCICALHVFV